MATSFPDVIDYFAIGVNSVSGETVIDIHFGHFDRDGLRRFEGTCKPAKPAF
jgi:hypothetical protein